MGKHALPIVIGLVGAVVGGVYLAPIGAAAGGALGAVGGGAVGGASGGLAAGTATGSLVGASVGAIGGGVAGGFSGEALTPPGIPQEITPPPLDDTQSKKRRQPTNVRRSGSAAQAISSVTGNTKLGGTG